MKKNGFTLAEVLITIGLLGVVAAMTLPSLQVNVARQQVGPSLAKAINTLENANKLILQDRGVRSLQAACDLTANDGSLEYLECLADYTAGTIFVPDGDDVTGDAIRLRMKDGITYSTDLSSGIYQTDIANLPRKYSGEHLIIDIDINGNRAPNELGRDRFRVIVDTYGSVLAMGSQEYATYTGDAKTCDRESQPSMYCGGSIVDNGYRVIYQYH